MNQHYCQQLLVVSLTISIFFLSVSGCKLQHKNADQKKKLRNDIDEAIIYTKPEDEIFHRVLIPILQISK